MLHILSKCGESTAGKHSGKSSTYSVRTSTLMFGESNIFFMPDELTLCRSPMTVSHFSSIIWQSLYSKELIYFFPWILKGIFLEKDMYLVECAWLWWGWLSSVFKCKNCNVRITGRHGRRGCPKWQRLFHENVFQLHEIQNVIVAKLEIEKKNHLSKRK